MRGYFVILSSFYMLYYILIGSHGGFIMVIKIENLLQMNKISQTYLPYEVKVIKPTQNM